jgi:trans-aconitate 2-methyltransferase
MAMNWSATQYLKFEAERNRPIHDLLAQIPGERVETAVDIGCGPGNSTEILHRRFPNAAITGLDSSAAMIEAARKRLPGLQFAVENIATWGQAGPFDLILANAVLQWLPDHAALLPRLVAKLAPGGSLAVQIPDNLDEPAHLIMREVAATGPWAKKLAKAPQAREVRHGPEWYYRILGQAGARANVWRTVYHHALADGAGAIVEWFKGTGLRPYLEPLDDAERAAFLDQYQEALAKAYPILPDGAVLLAFPRLFFVATRA